MLIRQTYIDQITPFIDMPLVKILTGVRRCGKSTMMLMLIEELKNRDIPETCLLRFNFDTLEWQNANAKQVFDIIKAKLVSSQRTYLFLDEIQEIEHWERLVNTFFVVSMDHVDMSHKGIVHMNIKDFLLSAWD